ncbi:PQQ-binding-like beta-propeller repeat protein [Streptomyces sp. AV19]|uniref:serine/threonine-protein kinase n=1 Tax=Streptomyces sp. AV19 TaxID=2793068 RepID=UPI0018FE3F61|nr:serine/threonine-protein kinase [Streptomyces sp. AV19]MBH1934994.1 PQQ-binding-like beta-propeller repeat protein [Streptomyces sp. AV19]MDG4534600.1 PQQ-binding-like beta-propeller repeat protein [Streptomyces sp. AV19]
MPPLRDTGSGLGAEDPEYAGRYRLEGRLGSGGMGVVHLAYSPSGLRLAVKVVHAEYAADPEFRARFRQEVAAARRVSGAFTAPVVDADPDCERPWMATLCIAGPTLASYIKEHGPLTPDEVRRLAAGLAEALRDIHRAGVVHRDLKPSNVLLADDGPKVIDFGISRPYDSELRTETGKLVGTPPFMAPEQFQRPREVGPAADVFALASLLVHAATGRGPFESDSPYLVAYQVVHDEPELAGVPADLVPLLRDCLAKEPADRPTPDAIMSRLPALAEHERPTVPRLPDVSYAPQPRPVLRQRSADTPVTHSRSAPDGPAAPRARWRRTSWFAVGALVVAALGVGAGWAVKRADSRGEPLQTRASSSAGASWRPWQASLGKGRTGRCSYAEGGLFCSAPGLLAVRIDALDGRVLWRRAAAPVRKGGAVPPGVPVVSGGLVHALSADGRELLALDAASGRPRRTLDVSRYPGRVFPADDDTILLAAGDGTMTALDARSGRERWRNRIPGFRSPVLSSYGTGPVYAVELAADDRHTRVAAVEPGTGRVLWQWTAAGNLRAVGARTDGGLHLTATDRDNRVTAVVSYDPAARRERRVPLDVPLYTTSAVARGDAVYLLAGDGGLTAVDTERGRRLWKLETSVSNASAPVADRRRVYFSAADGRLIAVDAGRGSLLGQTRPRPAGPDRGFAGEVPAPVVARGRVFGSAPDGTVFGVAVWDADRWR